MSCSSVGTILDSGSVLQNAQRGRNSGILGKRKISELKQDSPIKLAKKSRATTQEETKAISFSSMQATYECVKASLLYSLDLSKLEEAVCNFKKKAIKIETRFSVDLLMLAFKDILNQKDQWVETKKESSKVKVTKFLEEHNQKFFAFNKKTPEHTGKLKIEDVRRWYRETIKNIQSNEIEKAKNACKSVPNMLSSGDLSFADKADFQVGNLLRLAFLQIKQDLEAYEESRGNSITLEDLLKNQKKDFSSLDESPEEFANSVFQ